MENNRDKRAPGTVRQTDIEPYTAAIRSLLETGVWPG